MELDAEIQPKFETAINGMPVVFRMIARRAVLQRAERLAEENGRSTMGEEEIARGFFATVPRPFKPQMMALIKDAGIDYERYGLT